nr:uncharacterized protein LOC129275906 [Lytechinus pictus]
MPTVNRAQSRGGGENIAKDGGGGGGGGGTDWGAWNSWQSCTVTCGTGVRMRYRECTSSSCIGEDVDSEDCYADELCEDSTEISEFEADVGKGVVISCLGNRFVEDHPGSKVVWSKNEQPIEINDRFVLVDLTDLEIKRVEPDDEGVYVCAILSGDKTFNRHVVLLKIHSKSDGGGGGSLIIPVIIPIVIIILIAVVVVIQRRSRTKASDGKSKPKKSKEKKSKESESADEDEEQEEDFEPELGLGVPPPPPPPPSMNNSNAANEWLVAESPPSQIPSPPPRTRTFRNDLLPADDWTLDESPSPPPPPETPPPPPPTMAAPPIPTFIPAPPVVAPPHPPQPFTDVPFQQTGSPLPPGYAPSRNNNSNAEYDGVWTYSFSSWPPHFPP